MIAFIQFLFVNIFIFSAFTACNSSSVDPYYETTYGSHLKMDHYWLNKEEHIIVHRELCPYSYAAVEYNLTVDNIKSRYRDAQIDLCTYCKP